MYEQTQQDLKDFRTQMSDFWKRIPDDAWHQKTGTRDKDWTLHQLLAHCLSIAQVLNKAANLALKNEVLTVRNFDNRDQFGDWNIREIERLTKVPPNGLIVQFLQELRIAYEILLKITPDNAENVATVPQFSRPAPAIQYLQSQLSHMGVIHGAQAVVPLGREPLWIDFSPDFTQRVIGHYLNQWSLAYWLEEGADEAQIINFHINGDDGGNWHIRTSSDGATSSNGIIEGGNYDLFFDHPHTFFGVFTNYVGIRQAMVNGNMRIASDVRDTLNMLKLFAPKRPKSAS
ncbi:MAG: hypothetical protein AAF846_14000 [Chloroflexota bacterium]